MINLFDRYDVATRDLLISQKIAKLNFPTVIMDDNGFLPSEIDTPIKYFCGLNEHGKPLYFNQVKVPKYWRIKGNSLGAGVYDLDQERARIVFDKTDNTRIVKQVEWLDQAGNVLWLDQYDQTGHLFAKTAFQAGRKTITKYFDQNDQCVIERNWANGATFLHTGSTKRYFASWAKFTLYYLKLRHYDLDQIIYNTLDQSLAVTLLVDKPGQDTLIWQEKLKDQLPANMSFLLNNQTRTTKILLQNYQDWTEKQAILTNSAAVKFDYLGMIYPHPRGNELRKNALIFTNSDQIAHLKELVELLPQVNFSIAAITEMSTKLSDFGQYDNVELYPVVSEKRIKQLINDNDLYLDINYGNEILDAVRGAFEQNMLILGFKDTLHEAQFISQQNVFDTTEAGAKLLAERVTAALDSVEEMKLLIDEQRRQAGDVLAGHFKQVLGEK